MYSISPMTLHGFWRESFEKTGRGERRAQEEEVVEVLGVKKRGKVEERVLVVKKRVLEVVRVLGGE